MDNHHCAVPPHLPEDHHDEDDFFVRNNLPPSTKSHCHEFIHDLYPDSRMSEHKSQGYCSYTLQLSDPCLIIQFRPALHRLDLKVTSDAHRLFPLLTPETKLLGALLPVPEPDSQRVFVYSHSVLLGASLSSLTLTMMQKYTLVKSLARVFITSYNNCRRPGGDASYSSSSSSSASCENLWQKGKIGSSLASRMAHLHGDLPVRFEPFVRVALDSLKEIEEELPWVLTHGDLVPSNILVDDKSGEITGLIDWTEAEYLPFGVGFVGLEEVLGYREDIRHGKKGVQKYPAKGTRFRHLPQAEELRNLFWDEMCKGVPEMGSKEMRRRVEIARVIGGLLWYGIAFDNGKLDRVVSESRDDEEIQMLDMFLFGRDKHDHFEDRGLEDRMASDEIDLCLTAPRTML